METRSALLITPFISQFLIHQIRTPEGSTEPVSYTHLDVYKRQEFIGLLRSIDAYYPPEAIIRVVLDNHSAHISKETMAYLATRPGRFEYVHTPKHGSWLNLIECAFSKMARTFLRHIRVASIHELKLRILKCIDEMNATPVVFRLKKFDLEIA